MLFLSHYYLYHFFFLVSIILGTGSDILPSFCRHMTQACNAEQRLAKCHCEFMNDEFTVLVVEGHSILVEMADFQVKFSINSKRSKSHVRQGDHLAKEESRPNVM